MLGDWNADPSVDSPVRGGVLFTGDIGHLGPDGDLFVTGRRNDLIIRGGANVYPAEVEAVLRADGRVAQCCVLGLEDERLGERVVAAVVLTGGADADVGGISGIIAELTAACAERLASYKVPDEIVVAQGMPCNAMGKVLRREVAALFG